MVYVDRYAKVIVDRLGIFYLCSKFDLYRREFFPLGTTSVLYFAADGPVLSNQDLMS